MARAAAACGDRPRAAACARGLAIGADLIAGFPTETDALADGDGERFVAEAAIPYAHVFPYSERPGTPAARMPPVPVAVRRDRAARAAAALPLSQAAAVPPLPSSAAYRDRPGGARADGDVREHFTPRAPRDAAPGTLVTGARGRGGCERGLQAEAA